MEEKNIQARVISIIVKNLAIDEEDVTPEADLHELGADSLDIVELIMDCENEFFISIPDEYIETTRSVQQLITCVEDRCKNKK